jgi:CRP/FNR family nitrogen fixation transcriptional regulator
MSATMNTTYQQSGNGQLGDRQSGAPGWQPIPRGTQAHPLDLLAGSGMTISLPRDRELHAQGDQATFCYRVVSGCVRTVKLMEDGRRQVGAFLLAGDCLGFEALDTHDFAAQAVTAIVVQRYRRREVEAAMDRHPALARGLREMAGRGLRDAYDRMLLLGRKTASERIATFLLEMAARQASERIVALPMGRGDIADHLGLTIETVCRMVTHLRRDGTIAIAAGSVEVRNPTALRQLAADPRH